jgi:Flp pilus assembly pilin Flp
MKPSVQLRRTPRRRQRGLTIVEYAVAGGIVIAVTVAAFIALGNASGGQINRMATAIATNGAPPAPP